MFESLRDYIAINYAFDIVQDKALLRRFWHLCGFDWLPRLRASGPCGNARFYDLYVNSESFEEVVARRGASRRGLPARWLLLFGQAAHQVRFKEPLDVAEKIDLRASHLACAAPTICAIS